MKLLDLTALPFCDLVPIKGAVCDNCKHVEHQLPAAQLVCFCLVHGAACRHCATGILRADHEAGAS